MTHRRYAPLVASLIFLFPEALAAEAPGAFELLSKVRQAYSELTSYHDLGEIERRTESAGREQTTFEYFETAATADGQLLWRIHAQTDAGFGERVLWAEDGKAMVYDSLLNQYKEVRSVTAELAHGFGEHGFDALIVLLLLAGSTEALSDPQGAAVDGPDACGESSCWLLSFSRLGGELETQLWIDRRTLLIREIELRATIGQGAVSGPSRARAAGRTTMIHVRHHVAAPTDRAAAPPATFEPPSSARRVADWEPPPEESSAAAVAATTESATGQPEVGFSEEITVALFSVVARIVDSRGDPLTGLQPDDLIVRVGGDEVPVLALEWSSSYQAPVEIPPEEMARARELARSGQLTMSFQPPQPAGKLVVLFLQIDLEPTRITGHMKILPYLDDLLEALHPDDRVAIVSFDSHLKLWHDFSYDRESVARTLRKAIRYGKPAARRSRGISLVEYFDSREALAAASPERALLLTAQAMRPLPGVKDIIYIGWGLGRFGGGGVSMRADYGPALRALDAARASVFVLDVTQADSHSLEVGLRNVAAATGGTYASTFHFASNYVRRLARTISGHYIVTIDIDRGDLPAAHGKLKIELRDKMGQVLYKPFILG